MNPSSCRGSGRDRDPVPKTAGRHNGTVIATSDTLLLVAGSESVGFVGANRLS